MPTTAEHIAARDDVDLQRRLVAAAEQAAIPNAASEVSANLGRLVAVEVNVAGSPTSITAVHAYAAATRREALALKAAPDNISLADAKALIGVLLAPPPGQNPGAVTDPILAAAVQAVLATPQAL